MWLSLVVLTGVVAAETQCNCDLGDVFNPFSRTCAADVSGFPAGFLGNTFLWDEVERTNCDGKAEWDAHGAGGYLPVSATDKCSCVASNKIDTSTDPNTAQGYSWNYETGQCLYGNLKYNQADGTPRTSANDVIECAYSLVYGYPNSFSHCGSLNMCQCYIAHRAINDASIANPDNNATGNALNLAGYSNGQQCGWNFDSNRCVVQSEIWDGNSFFLRNNKIKAVQLCHDLSYFETQGERSAVLVNEDFVYVSPTVDECHALNTSVCTCNADARCFMVGDECLVNYDVEGNEVDRSTGNVTAELVADECGETYCNSLSDVCTCYETPYSGSGGGTCGWDGTECVADFATADADVWTAHCCDAFKTPCECKVGRLPFTGAADHYNTCGWDHVHGVCRLSAITTDAEMAAHGCAALGSCLTVDNSTTCGATGGCEWAAWRHTCVPAVIPE